MLARFRNLNRLLRRKLVAVSRVVQSVSDLSSDSGELEVDKERTPARRGAGVVERAAWHLVCPEARSVEPGLQHRRIYRDRWAIVLPLFERALRQVVAEAETLRLQFFEAGRRAAAVRRRADAPGRCRSSTSAREPDARAAAEAWMKADLARPVDPTRGPLFGFALFKASATRFFWYARYHHIVLDGYGMWLVARRVADVYTSLCARTGAAAVTRSVRSRRCWTRTPPIAHPSNSTSDRQYWSEALAARPEPGSLTLSSRPSAKSASFLRETACLPRSCEEALRALARSQRNKPRSRHGRGHGDLPASPRRRGRCGHRAAGGGARARRRGASPAWPPTCCRCGLRCIPA